MLCVFAVEGKETQCMFHSCIFTHKIISIYLALDNIILTMNALQVHQDFHKKRFKG